MGLLGFIPGLLCGLTVMIAVIAEGTLPAYFLPTPQPQVVQQVVHVVMTATPAPQQQPASQFIVVTATPGSVVLQPPTSEPVSVQVQPTTTPTLAPTALPQPTAAPADAVPDALMPCAAKP